MIIVKRFLFKFFVRQKRVQSSSKRMIHSNICLNILYLFKTLTVRIKNCPWNLIFYSRVSLNRFDWDRMNNINDNARNWKAVIFDDSSPHPTYPFLYLCLYSTSEYKNKWSTFFHQRLCNFSSLKSRYLFWIFFGICGFSGLYCMSEIFFLLTKPLG